MISPTPNMIAEKVGPVGKLIFNKPAKRNATSSDMWEAIPVIIDEFEKDPAIRVVVVTGRGRPGLRLGRRHLGVREGALDARAGRLLRQDRRGRQRAPDQVLQADHRPHPRLLRRRRRGGVADLRHPHRLGQLQVRRAGGAAWPRLPRGRHQDPDGRGRARLRQGDLLHRPPCSAPRRRWAWA